MRSQQSSCVGSSQGCRFLPLAAIRFGSFKEKCLLLTVMMPPSQDSICLVIVYHLLYHGLSLQPEEPRGPLLIPSYLNAEEQLHHILRALAGCGVIFSVGVVENQIYVSVSWWLERQWGHEIALCFFLSANRGFDVLFNIEYYSHSSMAFKNHVGEWNEICPSVCVSDRWAPTSQPWLDSLVLSCFNIDILYEIHGKWKCDLVLDNVKKKEKKTKQGEWSTRWIGLFHQSVVLKKENFRATNWE